MPCLIGAVVSVCPVCLSVVLLQYEQQMLPPRLEMEKLEDDIVKQVHKCARLISPHHPQAYSTWLPSRTLGPGSCQHPSNLRPCVVCCLCIVASCADA